MSEPKLVKRSGSENWYIRGTDGGRSIFKSTKTTDQKTAEALLTKYKARLLAEEVHGKVATITFHEAAEAYINAGGQRQYLFRELADGSVAGLIPYFKDKVLNRISQSDLDEAAIKLCRPGAARETLIRNVYTPFIAVWNFAAAAGRKWAEPCQWERPRKPKGTTARPRTKRSGSHPVSYDRAAQFIMAMSPDAAMVMTTLFYTGLRPIELYALDCGDVNLADRWITIVNSKTGEPRGVPIHEVLVPLLAPLVARGGDATSRRVFLNSRGAPYPLTDDETNGQLGSAISSARKRLRAAETPINDVSTYTGRHTVSNYLVMNGVHQHIKDQILGHAASSMSRRYVHVPQKPLIEAINTLPVLDAWANAPWMREPLRYTGQHYRPATGGHADLIIALRKEGLTMPAIAKKVNVSSASVFAIIKEAGLSTKRAKPKAPNANRAAEEKRRA